MRLVATLAILALAAASDTSRRDCVDNLRQLHGAGQTYVIQEDKSETHAFAAAELIPYLPGDRIPKCPAGGKYDLGQAHTGPSCTVHGTLDQAARR